MAIDTKRFAIETDAYGMRRMSPDALTSQLLDLRKQIGSLPFTAPGVVGLRLIAEVDIEGLDPVVAPDPPTPPEPAMAEGGAMPTRMEFAISADGAAAPRRPARARAKG